MKIKFTYQNSLKYIYATVSLIIVFCLLSLIEVYKNSEIQLFTYKLLNDFFTAF